MKYDQQTISCMMWCRCFVKYDFYYCVECRKCCVVNPRAAGGTDCDLDSVTLGSFLSLSAAMSADFQSLWTHRQHPSDGFHVCGCRVDCRVTVYVKKRLYQEQMVCLSMRFRSAVGQLSSELESYSEFLRR